MCLGVPGRIEETHAGVDGARMGTVSFGGVCKEVCLAGVPEASVGDYVVVHVGFAISKVDESEARQVFDLLAGIGGLDGIAPGEEARPASTPPPKGRG